MTDTKQINWNGDLMVVGFSDEIVEYLGRCVDPELHHIRITDRDKTYALEGDVNKDGVLTKHLLGKECRIVNRPPKVKTLHGRYVSEPEIGTMVYIMVSDGNITDMYYSSHLNPEYLRQGRLFTCREAAEWYREQEHLMQELREFSYGHKWNYWFCDDSEGRTWFNDGQRFYLNIPLMTIDRIKEAIKKYGPNGEDRLKYLGHWKECE